MNKTILVSLLILLTGAIFRIFLTWDGNFIFNMDNARDMVDVREMVELHQWRLIGPTSGIEGFYNGPVWYYLLAIPFILSSGNPFASIFLEIVLWVIGGAYLLKIVSRWGMGAVLLTGSLWFSSNYIILSTQYALNPNPVIFLTPLFIYYFEKYLQTRKTIFSVIIWGMAGVVFNLEMAFGVFLPIIILAVLIFSSQSFWKNKILWLGIVVFLLTLLPQVFFDFRHNFLMLSSLQNYFAKNASFHQQTGFLSNLQPVINTYRNVIWATFMNQKLLAILSIVAVGTCFVGILKKHKYLQDSLFRIIFMLILIPFLGYSILPIRLMPWHLGGSMVALLIILGFFVYQLSKNKIHMKFISLIILIVTLFLSAQNIWIYLMNHRNPNLDPSVLKNELSAIDYVYQRAEGKNFQVYVFLPSVIDYPYQYLFWWYGQRKYGYLPKDYAYLPDKPEYIRNKEKFNHGLTPPDSNLIFLIKEPNRPDLKDLWENSFSDLRSISKTEVGRLEIEIKQNLSQ